ncbi:MFS transporter [Actinoplanes sp. NPDC049316]|uniref:MFS transporter n=1 Tax=Actinoplanes sp. NPDC049316 TaxID=3154727 RepID=UPI00341E54C1
MTFAQAGRSGIAADGVRTFVVVSVVQFVALCAVTLLNFAAAYYVYQTYSLVVLGFVYALPFVVLLVSSPFSGSLIDRWGVRRALIVSNSAGTVLAAATLVLVPFMRTPALWLGVLIVTTVPLVKGLLLPAFEASVPMLVPKRHFGRANGMRMTVNGFGAVLLPYAAVWLVKAIGITAVAALVTVTMALTVLAVRACRIPSARPGGNAGAAGPAQLLAEFRQGWDHLRARAGLPALVAFSGVVAFAIGFCEVLLPQTVIAIGRDDALLTVLVAGFAGMTVYGAAMTVWGGPRRRVAGIFGYTLVLAAAMVAGSLRPSVALLAVAAFVFLGSTSIIVGNLQTVFHTKVEPRLQGRVMALKNVFYAATLMLGNISAGLSGDLLMPVIGEYEVRSPTVATVFGGGAGRAFAILITAAGALIAVVVWRASRHRALTGVELRLPDVTREDVARI